jgi:hypothetical protein
MKEDKFNAVRQQTGVEPIRSSIPRPVVYGRLSHYYVGCCMSKKQLLRFML